VLVNHLADGILEQDDELIEGFDLPLQLDAIDEVNRNGNALFAQGVQVRLLKGLAFAHVILLFLSKHGLLQVAVIRPGARMSSTRARHRPANATEAVAV
jgi:hypothetical protein